MRLQIEFSQFGVVLNYDLPNSGCDIQFDKTSNKFISKLV